MKESGLNGAASDVARLTIQKLRNKMSVYKKALKALNDWESGKGLPPKYNENDRLSRELNDQLSALTDELYEDKEDIEYQLERISMFEKAWDNQT